MDSLWIDLPKSVLPALLFQAAAVNLIVFSVGLFIGIVVR